MNKKVIFLSLVILLALSLLGAGCAGNPNQDVKTPANDNDKILITDVLGRPVELDSQAQRIVAIGPGALRLYCYFNNIDLIVGIEKMDKDSSTGKPYLMANPSLAELPVIGQGGPNNAPDLEKLVTVNPDVIFSTYALDKSSADEMQTKTGIPVVVLSYGKTSVFDPLVNESLKLIGEITGNEQRAQELIDFMDECQSDLHNRTKDIADSDKPKAYVGALGMKGAHGIESTQGNYSLFNAINAKNVVDETGSTGSVMIDKEKLLEWNPDKIFIDGGGYQIVLEAYKKNPEFYNSLAAVKNKETYLLLPYNFYTTNIDTAIADAYHMGKVLYPEEFKDIEPESKADEIYKFLLGQELYQQMAQDYGGFKQVEFK